MALLLTIAGVDNPNNAAVRAASDPDAALMSFFQSTYEAAADLAAWDRDSLEI